MGLLIPSTFVEFYLDDRLRTLRTLDFVSDPYPPLRVKDPLGPIR
jgi:hypothetical protein